MIRHFAKAIVFSVCLNLLYFGIPMISGLVRSYFYVPDLIGEYENVKYLQNEVSLGIIRGPESWMNILLHLLIGMEVYAVLIAAKHFFRKMRSIN